MAPKGKGKNKKSKKRQSKYKCELCDNRDNEKPIVACDTCDKWYHFSCVNIVSIGKKDTWICEQCKQPKDEPPKAKLATGSLPAYSCLSCYLVDNDEMVTCYECQHKFHYICVGLDLNELPNPYICETCCKVMSTPKGPWRSRHDSSHNILNERLKDISIQSNPPSIQCSRMSQSHQQKAQLELDYLEEQRKFHEKWDQQKEFREQQYLQRKYMVLKAKFDEADTARDTSRKDYTESWINSLNLRDRETIITKGAPIDSFDTNDFTERLNRLKFGNTSLQSNVGEQRSRRSVPVSTYPKLINVENPQSKFDNPSARVKLPTQSSRNEAPLRQKSLTFNEQNAKNSFVPKFDDNMVPPNDPLDQTEIRQTIRPNLILPNADLHLNPVVQQANVLTKAQISSRQVVKYSLHHFYGDPLEWISWYSSYESTTEMCGYTNPENLHRLKECLKGTAEKAVKHLFLSPTEVPNIIKILKMLFGRPELIVNALLKKVREIPAPRADKLETLVDYAMEVNSISVTIEAAKINYNLSNPNLILEFVEKLPVHQKIDWAKYKMHQPNITLKNLADWLYNLAEVVCTVTVPSSSKSAPSKPEKRAKGFERFNMHQIEDEKSKNPNSPNDCNATTNSCSTDQCKVCKGKCTDLSKCSTFKTYEIKQKWNVINKYKLCRKCLKSHKGYCRQTKECGVNGCVFKHHPLLHSDRQPQRVNQQSSRENSNLPVVTNNCHNVSIPNVLFRIVPVTLYKKHVVIKTFAYLDEGSSGTLLEEDLARELQSDGCPERLCLMWTNDIHRIEEKSHRMDIVISGQNEFSSRYLMKGVRTVENLRLPSQTINQLALKKKIPLFGWNSINQLRQRNATYSYWTSTCQTLHSIKFKRGK